MSRSDALAAVRAWGAFLCPKTGAAAPKFLTTSDIDNCGWTYNISSFCISHITSVCDP